MKPHGQPDEIFDKKSFGLRIEEIAKRAGGVKALADKAGLRTNQLYRYIQGLNTPAVDVVAALALAVGVSAGWIVTGQGDMDGAVAKAPDGYVSVPMFPTAERMEMERLGTDVGRLAFTRQYLEYILSVKPDKVYLEFVTDDTMRPTLFSGDLVLVDAGRGTEAIGDGVYLLRKNNFLTVKRIRRKPENMLELISDNVNKSVTVSKDDWDIIGPVIAVWRRFQDLVQPDCDTGSEAPPIGNPVFGL